MMFAERCGAVHRQTPSDKEPDQYAPHTPRRPSVMPVLYRTVLNENPAINVTTSSAVQIENSAMVLTLNFAKRRLIEKTTDLVERL